MSSPRFLYLIYFNVFLNIADLINLLRVVLKRRQKKQRYMTTSKSSDLGLLYGVSVLL